MMEVVDTLHAVDLINVATVHNNLLECCYYPIIVYIDRCQRCHHHRGQQTNISLILVAVAGVLRIIIVIDFCIDWNFGGRFISFVINALPTRWVGTGCC
jgi:hypothetical protein